MSKKAIPDALREHVILDLDAVEATARQWAGETFVAPEWRSLWYPEDDAEFVQFHGVADALNFCFREPGYEKFAVEWKDMLLPGSVGLMAALMRAREEGTDILDDQVLTRLNFDDGERIFRSDAGPLPLIEQRVLHLNTVGAQLANHFAGRFSNIFSRCDWDAGRIIQTLTSVFAAAYGGDVFKRSDGTEFRFDKRARLMPLIYEGRARSSDGALPRLTNMEAIGPIIDYQVAKTLRSKGIIGYSPNLAAAVDGGIPLEAWSGEELAIRWNAHVAVEELLLAINKLRDEPIGMVELDYRLWSAGRKLPGEHHLCMTTAY